MKKFSLYNRIFFKTENNKSTLVGFKISGVNYFLYSVSFFIMILIFLNKYFSFLKLNILSIVILVIIYMLFILISNIFKIDFTDESLTYTEFLLFFPIHQFKVKTNKIQKVDDFLPSFEKDYLYYFPYRTGINDNMYDVELRFYFNGKIYCIGNTAIIDDIVNFIQQNINSFAHAKKISK